MQTGPASIHLILWVSLSCSYPTDFNAMPDEWIERLSLRWEQLTVCLARAYISDLIHEPGATRS